MAAKYRADTSGLCGTVSQMGWNSYLSALNNGIKRPSLKKSHEGWQFWIVGQAP